MRYKLPLGHQEGMFKIKAVMEQEGMFEAIIRQEEMVKAALEM